MGDNVSQSSDFIPVRLVGWWAERATNGDVIVTQRFFVPAGVAEDQSAGVTEPLVSPISINDAYAQLKVLITVLSDTMSTEELDWWMSEVLLLWQDRRVHVGQAVEQDGRAAVLQAERHLRAQAQPGGGSSSRR